MSTESEKSIDNPSPEQGSTKHRQFWGGVSERTLSGVISSVLTIGLFKIAGSGTSIPNTVQPYTPPTTTPNAIPAFVTAPGAPNPQQSSFTATPNPAPQTPATPAQIGIIVKGSGMPLPSGPAQLADCVKGLTAAGAKPSESINACQESIREQNAAIIKTRPVPTPTGRSF